MMPKRLTLEDYQYIQGLLIERLGALQAEESILIRELQADIQDSPIIETIRKQKNEASLILTKVTRRIKNV